MPEHAPPTTTRAGFEFLSDLGGDLVIDTRVVTDPSAATAETAYLTFQVHADPLDAQAEHARLDASTARHPVPPARLRDCYGWCTDHDDDKDICTIDWGGISRLSGDGGHALARLTADEHELTELAGPRVTLAVLDPDDDTEAKISLSLKEALLVRDRLTSLLNEAFTS